MYSGKENGPKILEEFASIPWFVIPSNSLFHLPITLLFKNSDQGNIYYVIDKEPKGRVENWKKKNKKVAAIHKHLQGVFYH